MRLLIDTHILIWMVLDDRRLSAPQRAALSEPENDILLSAVNAYELTHLQQTGRIALEEPIDRLAELVGFELVDLPAQAWAMVARLPDIHRDPIDRMLIAHAMTGGFPLLTADANVRQYPVDCF